MAKASDAGAARWWRNRMRERSGGEIYLKVEEAAAVVTSPEGGGCRSWPWGMLTKTMRAALIADGVGGESC